MNADVLAGWALAGLIIVSPWLAAAVAGGLAGAAAACWWQHHRRGGLRDQKAAVAGLCKRIADLDIDRAKIDLARADARLDAALARAESDAYARRAQRERDRAAVLAEDVVAMQHQLAAACDRLRLAELDKRTDWEVEQP